MDVKKNCLVIVAGLVCLGSGTFVGAAYSQDLISFWSQLPPSFSTPFDADDETTATTIENHPLFEEQEYEEGFLQGLLPESLFEDAINQPPLKNFAQHPSTFDREGILVDFNSRISKDFHIPEGLRDRVGFWFDVYTHYDSDKRVIHHAIYPWVIFDVVDVSPIINADKPSRRWMRNEKADSYVKLQTSKIKKAIRKLTRSGALPTTPIEIKVYDALRLIPGKVHVNARKAMKEVRVQMGQKEHFISGLRMSQRYMTHMEDILKTHKLPLELSRIPFVESSFNKKATSKVGASGIWQFMEGTGKKFMRVDNLIDERRSPLKATEGAAKLLKENHMILHRSWPLAVTAWNHGPPGVRKAIRATGTKDLSKIVSSYRSRSFDFASSNFYSEFLAALFAEKYSPEIFGSLIREPEIRIEIVKLKKRTSVSQLMKATGLTKEEFFLLNPDLSKTLQRRGYVPAGYHLHTPSSSKEAVEQMIAGRTTVAQALKTND